MVASVPRPPGCNSYKQHTTILRQPKLQGNKRRATRRTQAATQHLFQRHVQHARRGLNVVDVLTTRANNRSNLTAFHRNASDLHEQERRDKSHSKRWSHAATDSPTNLELHNLTRTVHRIGITSSDSHHFVALVNDNSCDACDGSTTELTSARSQQSAATLGSCSKPNQRQPTKTNRSYLFPAPAGYWRRSCQWRVP
jgi:hypothetical protein